MAFISKTIINVKRGALPYKYLNKPAKQAFLFFLHFLQTAQQQLSKKEIEDLLRRGAYGALMDEEDEGAKFCEEDIDQILQRRTKTITIESEGRGSTFAKVFAFNWFLNALSL